MNQAIRLTNKTAIALRKAAKRSRTTHFVCAVALAIALCVLAVWLGLKWLPAAPLLAIAAVLLDTLIVIHGRNTYLLLLGQAICTEAAMREIRAGMSESCRREQAISDLIHAKADAQRAVNDAEHRAQHGEKPDDEPERARKVQPFGEAKPACAAAAHARRRRADGLKLIRSEQAK